MDQIGFCVIRFWISNHGDFIQVHGKMVPVLHGSNVDVDGKMAKVPMELSYTGRGGQIIKEKDCYLIMGGTLSSRPYWVSNCYGVTGEIDIEVSISREFRLNSGSGRYQIKYNEEFTVEVNNILSDRE